MSNFKERKAAQKLAEVKAIKSRIRDLVSNDEGEINEDDEFAIYDTLIGEIDEDDIDAALNVFMQLHIELLEKESYFRRIKARYDAGLKKWGDRADLAKTMLFESVKNLTEPGEDPDWKSRKGLGRIYTTKARDTIEVDEAKLSRKWFKAPDVDKTKINEALKANPDLEIPGVTKIKGDDRDRVATVRIEAALKKELQI